ncbi:MAG: dihydrofolate reductase [Opitutae bacterium]|nr:dihydrofolate reductase [Opitutae bacterium]
MRKLVYYVASSLDGYIARRDGSVDWLPTPSAKEDYGYAKFLERIDALIIGRKTYEQMLTFGAWPYGERKCYVLSRRWAGQRDVQAEFVGGNIATLLRRIKRQPGRDIWLMGGGESAHAFFEAGLVDEIVLTVIPTLLGEGLSLFLPQRAGARLVLRESQAFADGLVQLRYDVQTSSSATLRANPRDRAVA